MSDDTSLKAQLRAEMTASMKAGNKERTGTLRLLMAAVMAEEKSGDTAVELDDAGVQAVLKRQLKQRSESIEAYRDGGREEQAAAEEAEAEIISEFLPAAMSDEELEAKVSAALTAGGFAEMSQMGAAMKAVMAELGGDADGKKVSALVRSALS
ncbi:MAG: GatB/YqeY domain-containing protein [Acidimicrobiales bacterium]|nr:GatB/YqeY domain-containing protein [Acidimicrobiales bacterium]